MSATYKYEEALARLEYIAEQLERGDLTLEEALAFFEEGIKLVRICSKMLDEAEGKIQVLTKDLNSISALKDYIGGLELIE
ncbi:MAG TPA: exodeoxyribonuclease VII small subunit [Thermoanaerobacterales bacterium]|jgi:exodeoxyribonuclease VII small subunit|nr:exodeoxyribonuclease VII small subunit [Thermoanaerobacterales bacterium]